MTNLRRANYLDQFDEDTLPLIEQCVVFDGDRLHFTNVGLARFRERFARAGIDIRTVKTVDQLDDACRASFGAEMQAFADMVMSRKGPRAERALVAAIALGDEAEIQRLSDVLDRRRRIGLKLVSSDRT